MRTPEHEVYRHNLARELIFSDRTVRRAILDMAKKTDEFKKSAFEHGRNRTARREYSKDLEQIKNLIGTIDISQITRMDRSNPFDRIELMGSEQRPLALSGDEYLRIYPTGLLLNNRFKDETPVVLSPDFCKEYTEALRQFNGVGKREPNRERLRQILMDLDKHRRDVHDRGAQDVIQRLQKESVTIQPKEARQFFEALYLISQLPDKELMIYGEELGNKDHTALKEKVLQATELEIEIWPTITGLHQWPKNQFRIEIKSKKGEKISEDQKEQVERVIFDTVGLNAISRGKIF